MSSSRRAWVVAASLSAVEALKDQAGFCRWNYVLRSLQHHAKNNLPSISHSRRALSSSSSATAKYTFREGSNTKAKQAEESLRKVMFLSTWGPN